MLFRNKCFSLKRVLGLLAIAFVTVGFGAVSPVQADEVGPQFEHKLIGELSEKEKEIIQPGQPSAVGDRDQIIYVYRPLEGGCSVETDLPKDPKKQDASRLPTTGDEAQMVLMMIFGLLFFGSVAYIVVKTKKGKALLVLVLAGGGLLSGRLASAETATSLMEQIQGRKEADSAMLRLPQRDLACYEYVGYIHLVPKDPGSSLPPTPLIPEEPTTPVVPQVPEVPTTPTTPEEPTEPEKPVTPPTPEVPEQPEKPEEPETPVTPEVKVGSVKVRFVDQDGNDLQEEVSLLTDEEVGTAYDASEAPASLTKDGQTYELVGLAEVSPAATGQVVEGVTTVVYQYRQLVLQKAVIRYVNRTTGQELQKDTITGASGSAIAYSTADRIKEFEQAGFHLVSDGFETSDKTFDRDATQDQEFVVELEERVVPIGPNDPQPVPDQPVGPEDPAKWPKGVENMAELRRFTSQFIYYRVTINGVDGLRRVRREVVFERLAYVNLVTGNIQYTSWRVVETREVELNEPNVE